MEFDLKKAVDVLSRTPAVLETLLEGLSEEWIQNNEGENTWSPFDIVGHLIYLEKTDWLVRADLILSEQENKTFDLFDRFAQFEVSKGKNLTQLLKEYRMVREKNIAVLISKKLDETDFSKTGIHRTLGTVTLKQLLSAWVVHDLGHIAQISRVMAKQYTQEVGPWTEFLPVLTRK